MVAYNCQVGFTDDILTGRKRHTMRPPRKNGHAQPGKDVQLFTGMRTADCVRLLDAPCIRSVPCEVLRTCIMLEGVPVRDPIELAALARADGFTSIGNLQAWFDRRYGLPVRDLTLIEWDFENATYLAEKVGGAA